MSFGSPKAPGMGRRRRAACFSEINVTPMVDVMLVLLVVFMITAPMLTTGVPLDLPKTKAAKLNDQVEPVVISVDASGRSYLQETELQGDALIARLMVVTESNPDAKIYVRGDANLAYGRIMEVMGDIAASGFTKVSLLAEMPSGGTKAAPPLRGNAPTIIPAVGTAAPFADAPIMNVAQGGNSGGATASQGAKNQRPDLPTLQSIMPPQVNARAATPSTRSQQTQQPRKTGAPVQHQTQSQVKHQGQVKPAVNNRGSATMAAPARTRPQGPVKPTASAGRQTRPALNRG